MKNQQIFQENSSIQFFLKNYMDEFTGKNIKIETDIKTCN